MTATPGRPGEASNEEPIASAAPAAGAASASGATAASPASSTAGATPTAPATETPTVTDTPTATAEPTESPIPSPAPRFARVRALLARPWSLRARVLLGILATLALVSVSVAVLSVVALRGFLLAQLDDQVGLVLQRSEWALASQLGGPTVGAPPGLGTAQGSGTLGLVAVDGTLLQPQYYDERAQLRTLGEQQQRRLTDVAADGLAHSVELDADLGTYRVVRVPIADRIDLIAGLPQRQVDDTVAQLTGFVAGVTALGLLVAAAVGTLVVRVALRPLRRVTATAGRVAELPLDRGEVALAERVPDTDPHTEVGQLGAALNRMLEHVDAALAARHRSEGRLRRFVADASHELRTPLASIRGYSEHAGRVGRDSTVPLPTDITHSLGRIESESVRMSELVDELLLLARLDAGIELERRPVDVSSLLVDAVADAAISGPDHEWSLDAPGDRPLLVAGDPARLQQAVANLLANARLHTPPGTRIEVTASAGPAPVGAASAAPASVDPASAGAVSVDPASVGLTSVGLASVGLTSAESGGAEVRISVTDDGPGIDPALLPTLFERFVRGDESRSRQAGGTGLGLSITRAIVERHGGSVHAESAPGRTRFELRLPAVGAAARAGAEAAAADAAEVTAADAAAESTPDPSTPSRP